MDFNEINSVCNPYEEIVDPELIEKYQQIIDKGERLPEGIVYKEYINGFRFYKECSQEQIKVRLELSKAKNLLSIASSLKFFVILSTISIVAILVCFVIVFAGAAS